MGRHGFFGGFRPMACHPGSVSSWRTLSLPRNGSRPLSTTASRSCRVSPFRHLWRSPMGPSGGTLPFQTRRLWLPCHLRYLLTSKTRSYQMRNYCSRLFIFVAFVMTAWSGYGQGIKPGDVFQHSPIDSVDLKDLNSVIHIPLFSLPQRGTTKAMTFSISANTQIWSAWQECNDLECDYQYQASQPRYPSPDIFPNPSVGPWLVTDPQFGLTGDREIYPHDDSCGYYDEGICVPTHTNEYAINELFYFVDSTGARHKALYDTYDHTHLRTVDGSGYMVKYPNGSQPYNAYAAYLHVPPPPAIPAPYDRNGRTVSGSGGTTPNDWQYTNTDIDNNSITETATSWIDTVGRTIAKPALSTDVSGCAAMPAGTPAADYSLSLYQPGISKPFLICYAPVTAHTRFWPINNGQDVFRSSCLPTQFNGDCPANFQNVWWEWTGGLGDAMQSITRPDGTAWRFYYDNANPADPNSIGYGTLSRITFPTGGSLSYCYTLGTPPFAWSSNIFFDPYTQTIARTPLLSRRILDPDGGSIDCRTGASTLGSHAAEWDYSNFSSSNPPAPPADAFSDLALNTPPYTASPMATKIDLPDGNYQVYSFIEQSVVYYPPKVDRVVIDTYDTHVAGTPRVKRDLQDNLVEPIPNHPLAPSGWPVDFVTTPYHHAVWLDGIQTENSSRSLSQHFSFTGIICGFPFHVNPPTLPFCAESSPVGFSLGISTSGTDGPKSTSTQYKWLSDPASASAYQAANLIDAVLSQTVSENGSSATTTFAYDESGFVPSGAHIGHLTGVTRVNDSGPSPTTHTAWDSFGMIDHIVDAKGTTVSTNAAWDGIHLFPTVVQSPLGQESFSHDPNTGALLSATDLNGQTTTYTYDTAGRPLTVHNPDLSGTGTYSVVACYPDANTQMVYQAATTPLSSPSQDGATCPPPAADTTVTTVKADGLARITDNILASAPGGTVDTTT